MKTKALIMLLATAMLFAACKRSGHYADYEPGRASAADSASVTADTAATNKPRLVKSAGITFQVKNVQQTGENIAVLTTQYGGMVMHHQMHAAARETKDIRISADSVMHVSAFDTNADMVIRIPSAKLEDFMNKIAHLGLYVTESKMDIEDKTLDYLSASLKAANRQELVRQQKAGQVKVRDLGSVVALKDDLIDEQIGNKLIDAGVKYSIVSLDFYQNNNISKEITANDDPSAYNLPFLTRLSLALADGWNLFVNLAIILANLWVFIVLGFVSWLGYKSYRKKFPLIIKATA